MKKDNFSRAEHIFDTLKVVEAFKKIDDEVTSKVRKMLNIIKDELYNELETL